jgi:polar amino acid transport system permease protein
MSTSSLVSEELQPGPEPSKPRPVTGLAVTGVVLALVAVGLMVKAALDLRDYNSDGTVSTIVAVVLIAISLIPVWMSLRAFPHARQVTTLLADDKLVLARRASAKGRDEAQVGMGYAAGIVIIAGVLLFILTNDGAVASTFFASDPIRQSFHDALHAFWTNIWVACIAQVFVLVFGLVIAIMRMLPGRAGFPIRLIATVYCDVFRGIPAIVVIMLVGFGTPLAFNGTARWNTAWLGVIALTLTYTAYVSEVYRAGLSSIHPSQSAAARSLGLSYTQTLRTVLVPQAIRRVIPPLLNDFISLQKDTALLSVIGTSEILLITKLYEANLFILSPITLAAAAFVIITIPQARFVDYLIDRDAARRAGK